MSTPASIARHPIHPILVAFPIGLWVFSVVADLIYQLGWGRATWSDVAFYSIGGGIVGAWSGLIYSFGKLKQGYTIFLDNGQAYHSAQFPFYGLDGEDTRIAAELDQRSWGTYRFDGTRGTITLPYGEVAVRVGSQSPRLGWC